jgi:hypothetical protein
MVLLNIVQLTALTAIMLFPSLLCMAAIPAPVKPYKRQFSKYGICESGLPLPEFFTIPFSLVLSPTMEHCLKLRPLISEFVYMTALLEAELSVL